MMEFHLKYKKETNQKRNEGTTNQHNNHQIFNSFAVNVCCCLVLAFLFFFCFCRNLNLETFLAQKPVTKSVYLDLWRVACVYSVFFLLNRHSVWWADGPTGNLITLYCVHSGWKWNSMNSHLIQTRNVCELLSLVLPNEAVFRGTPSANPINNNHKNVKLFDFWVLNAIIYFDPMKINTNALPPQTHTKSIHSLGLWCYFLFVFVFVFFFLTCYIYQRKQQ